MIFPVIIRVFFTCIHELSKMYLIACYVRLAHQFLTLLWCASHLAQPFIIPIPVDSRILTLVCNFLAVRVPGVGRVHLTLRLIYKTPAEAVRKAT